MNAQECHRRAAACTAYAALTTTNALSLEFLNLASQWRALAVREVFLGIIDQPAAAALPAPILGSA